MRDRPNGAGDTASRPRPRIVFDAEPLPAWLTPEMIDAGAVILDEYGGLGPYTAKHLAEDVYRAMVALAPKSTGTG